MIEIKTINKNEYDIWYSLWQDYLVFYKSSLTDNIAKNNWKRFHDPNQPIIALGAYSNGSLIGFVHYIFHKTNWDLNDTCYLQDLYVDLSIRGNGAGRSLIEAVFSDAKAKGSPAVYWLTEENNNNARKLYDKITGLSGFVHYNKSLI